MKQKIAICLCFIGILLCCEKAYAYSQKFHVILTKKAINQNKDALNKYIENYIGLSKGVDNFLLYERVRQLIEDGSFNEDYNWNAINNPLLSHFYEPISNTAGVSYFGLFPPSAYDWANASNNMWSWRSARQYFYYGLVPNPYVDMNLSLAKAFEGIGHIIHLVQDMSVPAHTRADLHASLFPFSLIFAPDPYEEYTNKMGSFDYPSFSFPYWNTPTTTDAPKQFWDIDTYTGGAIPSSDHIGLAEYTNMNFFSQHTIFKNFPNPAKENTTAQLVEQRARDGKADKVEYVMGYQSERLAAYSYVNKYVLFPGQWEYNIDDEVNADYASQLIPRAVGYSAGLLNYFFRGTLEITPPDQYAYSVIDGSESPQQFTVIKAKVKNATQGEKAGEGIIQAVAKYKKIPNYQEDLSNFPLDGNVMKAQAFSYSVSEPIAVDGLSDTDPEEFTFEFSQDNSIPAGITDLSLQIIFKGTLGNEKDIAVAVGMKDLMEPTHHVIWNLTDMFALNWNLYTDWQIEGDPSLFSLVDLNRNGHPNDPGEPYISPFYVTFWVSYSGSTSDPLYQSAQATVPAGRYMRLISLLDKATDNQVWLEWSSSIDPTIFGYFRSFSAVVNQTDANGLWQAQTPVESFREGYGPDGTLLPIRQHFHQGLVGCDPMETLPDGTPVCPYPENEAIPAPTSAPVSVQMLYYP